jgi:hypothetical protein
LFLLIDVTQRDKANVRLPIRSCNVSESGSGSSACGLPERPLDRGASPGDQLEYQRNHS